METIEMDVYVIYDRMAAADVPIEANLVRGGRAHEGILVYTGQKVAAMVAQHGEEVLRAKLTVKVPDE